MKKWEIESLEKLLADIKGNELSMEEKLIQAEIKIELLIENYKEA